MTTELTKAAQQALEVLKTYRDAYNQAWVSGMDILEPDGDKAIDELESALTQRPAAQTQRPAAQTQRPAAQTEREAFEAWARPNGYDLRRNDVLGHYSSIDTSRAWDGFRAGRASLPAPQQATPFPLELVSDPSLAPGEAVVKVEDGKVSTVTPQADPANPGWCIGCNPDNCMGCGIGLNDLQQATPATPEDMKVYDGIAAGYFADTQQATPEPVGEPVARVELMQTGGNVGLATRIVEIDDPLRERLRPGDVLYTRPVPGVPEGFALVPAEPTAEMMEAMPSLPAIGAPGDMELKAKGWSLKAIQNRHRWLAALAAAQAKGAGHA